MNVLPDPAVMAELKSEEHVLHTASVVIHELSYGIHRLRRWPDRGHRRNTGLGGSNAQ